MASVSKRDFIILSFLSGNDFHSHENRTHLLKKKERKCTWPHFAAEGFLEFGNGLMNKLTRHPPYDLRLNKLLERQILGK